MKNGILRAMLLGIVASASFSLTQTASLAATSPAQMTSTTLCAANPAKTGSWNAADTDPNPAQNDRFIFAGP